MHCFSRRRCRGLQLHTTVVAPETPHDLGEIQCFPVGVEPIVIDFFPHLPMASSTHACDVPVGRYRVRATDANGERGEVYVNVAARFARAVVVDRYSVTAASTSHTRDGSVTAVGAGMNDTAIRYFWTNGLETTSPTLNDVPCGRYAVVAVTRDDDPLVMIHRSHPARVDVQ